MNILKSLFYLQIDCYGHNKCILNDSNHAAGTFFVYLLHNNYKYYIFVWKITTYLYIKSSRTVFQCDAINKKFNFLVILCNNNLKLPKSDVLIKVFFGILSARYSMLYPNILH